MTKKNFIKMHGLGNDFVVLSNSANLTQESIVRILDRRVGIGADQLIIVEQINRLQEGLLLYEMKIYNPDGLPAKMCGNATRCVTKLLCEEIWCDEFDILSDFKEKFGFTPNTKDKIALLVHDRILICETIKMPSINMALYSVNMGPAYFNESWMLNEETLWALANEMGLNPRDMMLVDMGNPHLVIIDQNFSDKAFIGAKLETHRFFPDRVNVDFVSLYDGDIHLEVWERGVGFTLACGSGASASFAACEKLGFVHEKARVKFALGELFLEKKGDDIIMTGPAEKTFVGYYDDK